MFLYIHETHLQMRGCRKNSITNRHEGLMNIRLNLGQQCTRFIAAEEAELQDILHETTMSSAVNLEVVFSTVIFSIFRVVDDH